MTKAKKYLVTLKQKRGVEAPFRRCVRDAKGNVEEMLVFPPSVPIVLDAKQFAAVEADVEAGHLIAYDQDDPITPQAAAEMVAEETRKADEEHMTEVQKAENREEELRAEGLNI